MPTLNKVESRTKLKPRREPYWVRLGAGNFLGFRKMVADSAGSWTARSRDPETGKQRHKALGEYLHLPASGRYDAAAKDASEWFKHLDEGGTTDVVTVKKACENYVDHVRADKGDKPAGDMKGRFTRWVYGDKLATVELGKLTRPKVEAWRKALAATPAKINRDDRDEPLTRPRAPASLNRDMAALRAALNHAHDSGHVTSDAAWRVALRPVKNADRRRELYLTRDQRKALIAAAPADLATFLRALSVVPLRPGALAALTAGDFNKKLSSLRVGKDKAGAERRLLLPPSTAALFATAAESKTTLAPLFARADGVAWNKDSWKVPLKEAAAAAKLPPETTAYALRHSAITDLVTGGLDLLTVAKLAGTSARMIEQHYGHLQADVAARALEALAL